MPKFMQQIPIPTHQAMDWIIPLLMGIGITVHPYSYFGGLFMAMAGSVLASRLSSQADRKWFWGSALSAFFIATIMAEIHQIAVVHEDPGYVLAMVGALPLQMSMALAGFVSGWVTRVILKAAGRLEDKVDTITDRAVDKYFGDDK